MDNELLKRFDELLEKAKESGFRVDGVPLARALLSLDVMERMERLVFDDKALSFLKEKAARMEFITDGLLPPELMEEPPFKSEPIYKQLIAYTLCKACRLCIDVCPKHVYRDDGFGRPGLKDRREEECTGPGQCAQCVDICPENAIQVTMTNPVFQKTIFVLLPNPWEKKRGEEEGARDFKVANPLEVNRTVKMPAKIDAKNLGPANRLLNDAGFYPILSLRGYPRHFVDSKDPEGDLKLWAKENRQEGGVVLQAITLLYSTLSRLSSLPSGKYRLDEILQKIIAEIRRRKREERRGGEWVKKIVRTAFVEESFLGAKKRPIGGLLPPGTSPAWKTPYGEEIPDYVHMEKCLGPECGLCVIHCPEGGGGDRSAIRMILKVPQGVIPSLVRGLSAFLLRLDGTQARSTDLEDLTGKTPFEFEVNEDYCKACGICIACCPHDVIGPATRRFDLRQAVG